MALYNKYITADDFLAYTGKSLSVELNEGDNPSNVTFAFINRVTHRLETYIDTKFHKNVDAMYSEFTDYQKLHFKYALLEQCLYVLENGEIGVDSGYEMEQGEVANTNVIESKVIGFYAKQELILCGLWNTQIEGQRYGLF